jgi:MFS family permease
MNKPAPSPTLVMALISIPIFIGALDLTVVSAVLPQVAVDLQIPQTEISSAAWIVSGYLLAYTLAMTFMGRLSDLVGRRRVYLLALAVFALGSYLVAVADGWPTNLALRADYIFFAGRPDPMRVKLYLLVAARMIQAFGGGAMVPVGMALAGDLYPAGRRARALGLIAAVDTSGWVVGHLYGGIIAYSFDWRIIFWLNLPACLIGFLLIAWALRRLPSPSPGGRMDWAGAALIVLCLIVLNTGLGSTEAGGTFNGGGEAGLPPYALPLTAAALILLGLFLWRQARAAQPLIPLSLFRRANFSLAGLENFLIGFCLFAAIAGVPLFINTLVAQSIRQGAWESGWMLSALTVPMALAAIPGGWLTARFGYRLPALAGLAVTVAGFLLMSGWRADPAGGAAIYPVMIPHLVLAGIGFGLPRDRFRAGARLPADRHDVERHGDRRVRPAALQPIERRFPRRRERPGYGRGGSRHQGDQRDLPPLGRNLRAGPAACAAVAALPLGKELPMTVSASPPETGNRNRTIIIGGALALAVVCACCVAAAAGLILDPFGWNLLGLLFGRADPLAASMPADTTYYLSVDLFKTTPEKINRILQPFSDALGVDETQDLDSMMEELDKSVLSNLDMTFKDDIEPWIGQFIGVGIQNIQFADTGPADTPGFILAVETRNGGKADTFLKKLRDKSFAQSGETLKETQYQGVTIYSSTPQYGQGTAFTRSGNAILLGTSLRDVQDAIDAQKGDSLADSGDYRDAVGALPSGRILTMYMDMEKMIDPYLSILESMGMGDYSDSMNQEQLDALTQALEDNKESMVGTALSVSIVDAGLQIDVSAYWTPVNRPRTGKR